MRVWSYMADRRLTPAEQRSQPVDRTCLFCGGYLLRLAERNRKFPYHWHPCGYVCNACNAIFVEVFSS